MTESPPTFRYHPDPLGTGSVVQSGATCERCGQSRGLVYDGPTYAVDEIEVLCPWCIADGSAAREFGAEFTTVDGEPNDVGGDVLDEVVHRTPGFAGWQQERWLFHCADAAAFLGRVGWEAIGGMEDVVESLVADGWARDALPHLHADGDLTAYLFRCLACGKHLAFADAS